MKIIGRIDSKDEAFTAIIREDDAGRVYFKADGDIDADGANGQGGGPAAYGKDDSGTEKLANGGMAIREGKVICELWPGIAAPGFELQRA